MGCSLSSHAPGEDRPEAKPGEKSEEELLEAYNENGTIGKGSKPITEQSVLSTPNDPAEAICKGPAELAAETRFTEAEPTSTSEPTPGPEPTSTSEPIPKTEPMMELIENVTCDPSDIEVDMSNNTSGNKVEGYTGEVMKRKALLAAEDKGTKEDGQAGALGEGLSH